MSKTFTILLVFMCETSNEVFRIICPFWYYIDAVAKNLS